jgi:hypothetical protein
VPKRCSVKCLTGSELIFGPIFVVSLSRVHAIKEDIVISHVGTNDQLANIFTKPLDESDSVNSEVN